MLSVVVAAGAYLNSKFNNVSDKMGCFSQIEAEQWGEGKKKVPNDRSHDTSEATGLLVILEVISPPIQKASSGLDFGLSPRI